jgi:hypothetical protein
LKTRRTPEALEAKLSASCEATGSLTEPLNVTIPFATSTTMGWLRSWDEDVSNLWISFWMCASELLSTGAATGRPSAAGAAGAGAGASAEIAATGATGRARTCERHAMAPTTARIPPTTPVRCVPGLAAK